MLARGYSLHADAWLTPSFHVSMNYRHITLDSGGASDGINARVLLVLE